MPLAAPMYLIPVTDPERIKKIREKMGMTEEHIARAQKEFKEPLKESKEWAKKHPEEAKGLDL